MCSHSILLFRLCIYIYMSIISCRNTCFILGSFYWYLSIHSSLTYETFRAVYLRRKTSSETNAIRRSPLFVAFPRSSRAGSKGFSTPMSHRSRRSIRLFPIGNPPTFPAAEIGPSSLLCVLFCSRGEKTYTFPPGHSLIINKS